MGGVGKCACRPGSQLIPLALASKPGRPTWPTLPTIFCVCVGGGGAMGETADCVVNTVLSFLKKRSTPIDPVLSFQPSQLGPASSVCLGVFVSRSRRKRFQSFNVTVRELSNSPAPSLYDHGNVKRSTCSAFDFRKKRKKSPTHL